MTHIRKALLLICLCFSLQASAGFGIQVGALSPNSALDDNDNGLMIGADLNFKFAVLGLKVEAFYIDSSGRYINQLADVVDGADIDIEGMIAADLMFYPLATTFFLQVGVNYTVLDAEDLFVVDEDIIDNQLGLDLGLGITVFDKLMLQAKAVYTPGLINGTAADILDMDEHLVGFVATAGWRF